MAELEEHFKRLKAIEDAKKRRLRPPNHNDPDFWAKLEAVHNGEQLKIPAVVPLAQVGLLTGN